MKLGWREGRHGGYEKLPLLRRLWPLLGVDLYLIRYRTGNGVKIHVDTCDRDKEHHRINVVTWRPRRGGDFYTKPEGGKFDWRRARNRVIRFRPDVEPHGVLTVKAGTRLVFSVGWLRKKALA